MRVRVVPVLSWMLKLGTSPILSFGKICSDQNTNIKSKTEQNGNWKIFKYLNHIFGRKLNFKFQICILFPLIFG